MWSCSWQTSIYSRHDFLECWNSYNVCWEKKCAYLVPISAQIQQNVEKQMCLQKNYSYVLKKLFWAWQFSLSEILLKADCINFKLYIRCVTGVVRSKGFSIFNGVRVGVKAFSDEVLKIIMDLAGVGVNTKLAQTGNTQEFVFIVDVAHFVSPHGRVVVPGLPV